MAWTIIYTIEDEKNKKSTTQVNIDGTQSLTAVTQVARVFATLVNAVIRGAIRAISVSNAVDLPNGLRTSPLTNSDVEEGARFQFITENGHKTGFRIPTFDEGLMNADGSVDIADSDVATLLAGVVGSYDFDPDPIGVLGDIMTDTRDEDIESLSFAREQFLSSRGSGA